MIEVIWGNNAEEFAERLKELESKHKKLKIEGFSTILYRPNTMENVRYSAIVSWDESNEA